MSQFYTLSFNCDLCNKKTSRKEEIETHLSRSHNIIDGTEASGDSDEDVTLNNQNNEKVRYFDEEKRNETSKKVKAFWDNLHVPGYDTKCDECLLSPCFIADVPERHQSWIPVNQNVNNTRINHCKRLALYKKAHSSLNNIGAFNLSEYKVKKKRVIRAMKSQRKRELAQKSKREIMPICVVNKIR